MQYALGLIFDESMQRVVLMRKNRPEWQKGRFNGVGGKVESGEDARACIVREVMEESGLETSPESWKHVATFQGEDWTMDTFATITLTPDDIQTLTDEEVGWFSVAHLPDDILTNIPWLTALAIDRLRHDYIASCTVTYREHTS